MFDPNPEKHVGYKDALQTHIYAEDKDTARKIVTTSKKILWQDRSHPPLSLEPFADFLKAREHDWGSLLKVLNMNSAERLPWPNA
eukprot:4028346-Prorocentrum_lima.AAC.1